VPQSFVPASPASIVPEPSSVADRDTSAIPTPSISGTRNGIRTTLSGCVVGASAAGGLTLRTTKNASPPAPDPRKDSRLTTLSQDDRTPQAE
jgi:hypothetical protein